MRVYLPSTLPLLAQALADGELHVHHAYAVTPALREWYADGDTEELEYAAMLSAARASLRVLAGSPETPPRRVVLAAEVPDGSVAYEGGYENLGETDRAEVRLRDPLPLKKVVSAHVDDPEAAPDILAAAKALGAADQGDPDAQFTVDGAEGHELMWYATQELPDLV
ncbi:hypothetical protein ABGB12_24890 [Actinocorallia sp. B10E7]|uniref:DUF6912 family protein n=1 Tax=Actinocorallia sp. B10E7 TaxID=3153558 RepID=UPI00325E0B47